ncbi:MAG TPA: transposase [Acidobacteriaceae bacterium]|nr:transposase [Acidobacteriaceae bacterium]
MVDVDVSGEFGAVPRRRWSAVERRRVVEETLEAGASVARVALRHGVNANQVLQWRRLYWDGKLGAPRQIPMKLLPVSGAVRTRPLRYWILDCGRDFRPQPVQNGAQCANALHHRVSLESLSLDGGCNVLRLLDLAYAAIDHFDFHSN